MNLQGNWQGKPEEKKIEFQQGNQPKDWYNFNRDSNDGQLFRIHVSKSKSNKYMGLNLIYFLI